jgi:hypothetical protein
LHDSSEENVADSRRSLEIRQTIRPRNLATSLSFSDLVAKQKNMDASTEYYDRNKKRRIDNALPISNKRQTIGSLYLTFSPVRIRPSEETLQLISVTA